MKITVKKIKRKEYQDWIDSGKAKLRNDLGLQEYVGWLNYYLLESGEFLLVDVYENRVGTLYNSLDDFRKMLRKGQKYKDKIEKYSSHNNYAPLSYYRMPKKDFNDIILKSGELLSKAFSLKAGVLDFSVESMKPLSTAVKKQLDIIDIFDFEEKYFILLTAYCGEVIRKKVDGHWEVKSDNEGFVGDISVYEKDNTEYSYRPHGPVLEVIAGNSTPSQLGEEVIAELHKHGFIKD